MFKKERKYYVAIAMVVVAYLLITLYFDVDVVSKKVTTVIALISAVTFWLQLKRSERLNESSFIMNLNNQFIGNKDMTMVEHELELYYNQFEAASDDEGRIELEKVSEIHLGLSQSRTDDDCQKMIDYLVYLEAMAALVDRQVIHLDVIDDLFSYRFFLAVNNPVVQENELIPYADYKGSGLPLPRTLHHPFAPSPANPHRTPVCHCEPSRTTVWQSVFILFCFCPKNNVYFLILLALAYLKW